MPVRLHTAEAASTAQDLTDASVLHPTRLFKELRDFNEVCGFGRGGPGNTCDWCAAVNIHIHRSAGLASA